MKIPMLVATFVLAVVTAGPVAAHPSRVPHRRAVAVRPVVVAPAVVPVRRAFVPVGPVRRAVAAPVFVAARPVVVRPRVRPRLVVRYR